MKNVAVAPCKKASEQWVMCRDFFRILTRTLKTEQPARSDTRIEQAFSVSFLEIRPGNIRTRYRNGYGVRTGAKLEKGGRQRMAQTQGFMTALYERLSRDDELNFSGTLPLFISLANPNVIAVFPTPGSPT